MNVDVLEWLYVLLYTYTVIVTEVMKAKVSCILYHHGYERNDCIHSLRIPLRGAHVLPTMGTIGRCFDGL